ncbi:DUF6588 family protein [Ulvibacter antarcticus]|uniref:Uncharacterized protein n=1 Tax=Ulvibacter antarcticus TaxID=442714 RepID=A0A3L9YGM1_9FLAO|nr:DUF6588 family protein [Ulvibacter antarcticus]RMA57028.1 hypothetical protein BXY75_2909 [Ulvibacter antarcticus]
MRIEKRISVVILLLFCSVTMFSQTFVEDVEDFLTDMVLISNQYVSPAADASVYQSSASWHHTARSLDKFEFDVSVHLNVLPIPKKQQSFKVSNSDFIRLTLQDGSNSANIPSALGGETNTFFDFVIDDENYEFQAFEGVKESVLYYPYLQVSMGLWKETEVTVQFIPEIKIDKSGYQTFGGAIKHNISQYFRNENTTDGFELAGQIGYSKFKSEIFFDEFVIESTSPGVPPLAVLRSLNVDSNSWLFQVIGSKRFKNLEFVGSMAVATNKFDYTMGGDDGIVLNLLNEAFKALEDSNELVKGNVGINYYFGDFNLTSLVSLGKFTDVNFAVHYRI